MNVYFDLPNLRAYAKAGGHKDFQSCVALMRQNYNIKFRFDKAQLSKEKKQSYQCIMNLVKLLTRNRGDSEPFKWNESYPPSPLSETMYLKMSKEQLTSIYFLSDNNIQEISKQGCLLFASEGNEINVLSNLLIDEQAIPTKKYPIRKMVDWSVIRKNSSPCTDIIIIDPYLFAQSDTLFEYNSYSLIENLTQVNTHHVNVVIFTMKTEVPFNMIYRNLKERIGEKISITFVNLPNTGKWKEHDRTIITNYKMFDSNPSFTYFDEHGKNICNGRWLNVNSHGHKDVCELSINYIEDLQEMIDDRKKGLNTIIGDKISNFLDFS